MRLAFPLTDQVTQPTKSLCSFSFFYFPGHWKSPSQHKSLFSPLSSPLFWVPHLSGVHTHNCVCSLYAHCEGIDIGKSAGDIQTRPTGQIWHEIKKPVECVNRNSTYRRKEACWSKIEKARGYGKNGLEVHRWYVVGLPFWHIWRSQTNNWCTVSISKP